MTKFIVYLEMVCSSALVGIGTQSFILGMATFCGLFAIIAAVYDRK